MAATLDLVIRGVDQASGVFKDVGKETEGLSSKLGALIAVAGGVVAGFASFKTLSSAIDKTQELGSAVSKLTRETGLSEEESSRLLFAFRRVGLDAGSASTAIGIFAKKLKGMADEETGFAQKTDDSADKLAKLSRRLGELNTELAGAKTPEQVQKITNRIADLNDEITDLHRSPAPKGMIALLQDLGINAMDAAGNIRPISALLPELADRFKAMPAGLEKSALAMQLFGRGGKDMLPLLNLGSEGLAEMAEMADKLGVTLTGENVAAIKKYSGAQREMGEALGGLKIAIGLELMPILTTLTQFFIDAQPTIREFISNGIETLKGAIEDISKNVSFLAFIQGMRDGFRDILDVALQMKEQIPDALSVIGEAAGKIPGIDKLTDLLSSAKGAGEDSEKAKGLGEGFAKAAAGILAFSVAVGMLDATTSTIGNVTGAMAGLVQTIVLVELGVALPILAVVAALVALGAAAFLIEKKTQFFSKELLPAMKDLAQWVQTKVVPAVQEFAHTELIPRLQTFGAWLQSDFIPTVKRLAEGFRRDWLPVIKNVALAVGNFLLPIFDTLHDFWVGAMVPTLKGAVIPVLEALGKVIGDVVQWFREHETATKIVVAALTGLAIGILLLTNPWLIIIGILVVVLARWDDISKVFTVTIPQAIDSVITKVKELPIIGAIFTDTFNMIKAAVELYLGIVMLQVQFALDTIRNTFAFFKAVFSGDWGAAWNALKDQAVAIWSLLSGLFGLALDAFFAVMTSKLAMLRSIGSTIANAIADGFKGAWNAVADEINNAIPDRIGFDIPSIDVGPFHSPGGHVELDLPDNPIPRLAAGGLIMRPTLALLGERGPEAVIPLGRGGGGMGITITGPITVIANDPQDFIEQLRRYAAA